MKTTTPRFALLPTLAVAFLLLSTHVGQCYYNPGTGRWLSRDPVEERGGLAVYSFVRNNCLGRIDPQGLSDDVYFGWTPFPLAPGPFTRGRGGEVWETPSGGQYPEGIRFRVPTSQVDCCFKVHVYSEWGAKGWYDQRVDVAKAHEEEHYKLVKDAYGSFISTVKRFDRKCMSSSAAACYKGLVGAIAAAAWQESRALNLRYDSNYHGDGSAEATQAEADAQRQWANVYQGLGICGVIHWSLNVVTW
jgi:uncharacterized protein RhaS with RHS repeats